MPTGDTWVNLVLKRFLSHTRLRSNFLGYLKDLALDLGSRIFPSSGLFTFDVTITPTITDFDLSITPSGDIEGIDDQGHVLILETGRQSNIPFENTPGDNYWLGLHHTEVPEEMIANPRTGLPEYDKWRDEVGESAAPNSPVVDMGGGVIRLQVDSIFEAGVDHSGRSVMVWLNDPMSTSVAVAIETVTSFYSGGNNYIDTVGSLGQGTISTNVGDYSVAVLGVTIRKNITNPFDSTYVLLGYITGHAVAPTTNVDGQRDLSGGGGHTLQRAYDGLAAGGSGRTVTAADEAIQIRQSSSAEKSEDIANAALRIRKDLNTALPAAGFDAENAIDTTSRFKSYGSILARKALADFSLNPITGVSNDQLRHEETADITAAATLTLQRVGVDLTMDLCTYSQIRTFIHFVEISGSILGNDGLYVVNGVPTAASVLLRNLDTSIPSLTLESGVDCRFYAGMFKADQDMSAAGTLAPLEFWREAFGNQTAGRLGNDLPPAFNSRNEWIDFNDVGTVRRVTFAGTETLITHYISAINAILVDSLAHDVGGEVRVTTIRKGSGQDITIDAAQSVNMISDVFGTTTPTEVAGTEDTSSWGTGQGVFDISAVGGFVDAVGDGIAADALLRIANFDVEATVWNEIFFGADGHIQAEHYLRTNDNIYAPSGRISVRDNVTSQQGNVEATLGDVTAGDDMIAADAIIATAGNITALAGDVVAFAGDVSARDDFIYGIQKLWKHVIPLASGQENWDSGSQDPTWIYVNDPAIAETPYWIINNTTIPPNKTIGFGFRLPDGFELNAVTAIIEKTSTIDITMTVSKRQPNWSPSSGAFGAETVLGSVNTSAWGAGPVTDALQLGSLIETIDENDHYYIDFESNDDLASGKLYAVRLELNSVLIRP